MGVLLCASSCFFEDDWDEPSNWYGHWEAQRNEYEITGIDIDKNKVTVYFSESDYFNYNRERYGSSHSVKYTRGVKEFDNGCTFVSFSFEKPLFVYPEYDKWSEIKGFVKVKKVYVTTPMSPFGYKEFEMLDEEQHTYVRFFNYEYRK